MEVHHHPHLGHKEKPWKEYLLEGLMIFLAVSMGFIAENIREHLSEQNKKKELIEMVALDFERDINQLEFHKQLAIEKIKRCDTLIMLLDSNKATVDQDKYYRLLKQIQWWWFFNSNNKSRTEADSKGYLSSVQNTDLAYSILKYNFFNTDYKAVEDEEMKEMDMLRAQMQYITDHKIYDQYWETSYNMPVTGIKGIKNIKSENLITTKYILTELKHSNSGYIQDADSMKVFALKSIENIKKQNH
jgi:hypothetical protein